MQHDVLIANRYELTERIGSGAMGDVYRATDTQSGQTVAVKHLKPDLVRSNPDLLTRFQREGEALRDLNHPNIVRLLDVVEDGDQHYLVMEYIPGGDLSALISDSPGGLPIERVLNIALDLADALTRAHRLDIIHRDLKPANILIAEDGTPRLSDFGIAHFSGVESLTDSASLIGTFYYLAPEVCLGQPVDHRADIWAFGIVVCEMLTGKRPFDAPSPGAIVNDILNAPFPDPQKLRPDISDDLNDLLYRMLEKQRDSRIPSVRLVGAELEALLTSPHTVSTHRPVAASPFTQPAPGDTGQLTQSLPRQSADFIGREGELAELNRLVGDPSQPLITIMGPGGIGKSRLAIEVGHSQTGKFEHGAAFVELAPIDHAADIPGAIASALDLVLSGGRPARDEVLDFLRDRQMLLILDNFEHVLEGRDIVTDILQTATRLTIIVTSRARLTLSNETVFILDPMDFPQWESPEDALTYSAVRLFMQSAKRVRVDFELQADELDHLTRICRLVEGLPLGILLAAAWVDTLSLAEIAEEIQSSKDFLARELADLPERQRSMRGAFDYSWRLLDDDERAAFARMSVFRGGFTRKAAQTITGISLPMLTALVSKSLLRRDQESGRFEIHELLRQFGEEHLDAQGEIDTVRGKHSAYYLDRIAEREPALKGHVGSQLEALNDIDTDFENVRVAWRWAIQGGDAQRLMMASTALALFSEMRSRLKASEELLQEARTWLEEAHPASAEWAMVLSMYELIHGQIKPAEADITAHQKAVSILQSAGDGHAQISALYAMGWAFIHHNQYEEAIKVFEQCVTLSDGQGEAYFGAHALDRIGFCHILLSGEEEYERYTRQAMERQRGFGDLHGLALSLYNLSVSFDENTDPDGIELAKESLRIRQLIDDRAGITWSAAGLVYIHLQAQPDIELARQYAAMASKAAEGIAHIRTRQVALSAQIEIAVVNEDYEEALRLLREGLELRGTDPQDKFYLYANMATAYAATNDPEAAREHLRQAVHYLSPVAGRRVWLIGTQGLIDALERHDRRAVTRLSVLERWYVNQSPNNKGIPYPLFSRILDELRDRMGKDTFEEVRALSQELEVSEVFREIFGDWLDDDDS